MSETPDATARPPRWRRWLTEGLIAIALLTAIHVWQTRNVPQGIAPHFTGQTLDGNVFDLEIWRREYSGKAVLIYFWAEWCAICKTTAGSVSSIQEDWPVISIAMQSGAASAVAETMRQRAYLWPTIADPDAEIFRRYGLHGVPAFVIIAPDGNIRAATLGYTSEIGLRLRLWWAQRNTT